VSFRRGRSGALHGFIEAIVARVSAQCGGVDQGPGDRKSIQPTASREAGVGYDQLHHFVASALWDSAPRVAALLKVADHLAGGEEAYLIIGDMVLPK
jgi:DDE superfamily endonuclease